MRAFIAGLLLAGCAGPPASDAEVCRDVITRLCHGPMCPAAQSALGVDGGTCEPSLLLATGCGSEGFAFTAPSRERVLFCRSALVETSDDRQAAPTCSEVDDALGCADLVAFLRGGR